MNKLPNINKSFLVGASSLLFTALGLSPNVFAQTKAIDLKNLIECQSNYAQYSVLAEDDETQLKKLGWLRQENSDQPFIYIYQHKKPHTFFGQPTHEIGLTGNAIVAILGDVEIKKLAQIHGLTQHPFFKAAPYFRGEKVLRTETPSEDQIPVHHKLMLSEMTGPKPMVLLGCNYELDRESMEKFLSDLDK